MPAIFDPNHAPKAGLHQNKELLPTYWSITI
jgi:hypothetical protein